MTILECENISFSYDGEPVISDLSFLLPNGAYLCIVGENGAGKSTLLKGILGLLKPSYGKIWYRGGLCKNEIGYLSQQTAVSKDFPASCYEVVLSGTLNKKSWCSFYSKKQRETAKFNMEMLRIADLKNKCFHEISGGQRQRVLLARALCATKKLLVMDEPVSGLDPLVTKELYELIGHLNKCHGISVIMISHDILGAILNATHILHLEHDKSFFGSVGEYIGSDFSKKFLPQNSKGGFEL